MLQNPVTLLHFLHNYASPPPAFTRAVTHCVSAFVCFPFAGNLMIVSLTADVSYCSFPRGQLQTFPTPPYLILCCLHSTPVCACKLWCMPAVACAHVLLLKDRLLKPEVTTHKSESVIDGSFSPSFSPFFSLFDISAAESFEEET